MSWNKDSAHAGFSLGDGACLPPESQEEAHPTSTPVSLTSNAPNRSQTITGQVLASMNVLNGWNGVRNPINPV